MALFVLKESLPEEKRRKPRRHRPQSVQVAPLQIRRHARAPSSTFLVVFIIVQLAGQMPGSLWIISSMDRYDWSRELVGRHSPPTDS